MPVVFRSGGFRVFFYSNEGTPREPMHVHVRQGNAEAKVWLEPEVAIADSRRFNARTLREVLELVSERRREIEEVWHGHFRN